MIRPQVLLLIIIGVVSFALLMFVPVWLFLLIVYAAGFLVTMVVNLAPLGMVTFGLALLRSLVWPVWITTGRPCGTPLPMD